MNDTTTPRTDTCAKSIDQSNFEDSWKDDFEEFAWVTADFARTLETELTAVTEQRDRLAEAMGDIAYQKLSDELDDYTYEHANWEASWDYIINTARKALQSLNQNASLSRGDESER